MKKASMIFLLVVCDVFLFSTVGGCDSRSVGVGGHAMCGNGVLDPGEGCDDGNRIALDGCGETCQVEASVDLVLLDNRIPWTLRSVRIDRGGILEFRDEYVAGQGVNSFPDVNKKFESVVACGANIYVALEGLGKIVHLSLDAEGHFHKKEANRCMDAHSLACDCEAGLLFATSRHSSSSVAPLELHIYAIGDQGELRKKGQRSIWPSVPNNDVEPFWEWALQHSLLIRPGTHDLWLTVSFTEFSSGSPCRSWRFSYNNRGGVSAREASRFLVRRYVEGSASFSPDGTKYFLPRLNNRCFAWVDLRNRETIPSPDEVYSWCNSPGSKAQNLAFHTEEHRYYFHEPGQVSVARLGYERMVNIETFATPVEGEGFLKLLFGGEILLVIGFDGKIATHCLDEGGENATLMDSMELGEGSLSLGSTALIAR